MCNESSLLSKAFSLICFPGLFSQPQLCESFPYTPSLSLPCFMKHRVFCVTWGLYSSLSQVLVLTPFHLSLSESLFLLLAYLVPALYSPLKGQLPCGILQLILDWFIKAAFEVSLWGLFLRVCFTCSSRFLWWTLCPCYLYLFSQGRLQLFVNCLLSKSQFLIRTFLG